MGANVKVRCANCKKVFYRYNYGKGRHRWRRYGKNRRGGNPLVPGESHARVTDSCILCRGTIEVF